MAIEVIKTLLDRVRVLEEEVARLKKNSSNSSKPPSSDITKPASEQRQPDKHKIGGQARHPGKQRDLLPPDKVDHRVPLMIEICPIRGKGSFFSLYFWFHEVGNEDSKLTKRDVLYGV